MMKAIISDIHSNLEALEAVLAEIHKRGITEIISLGDIIGYGPNPRECINLVMEKCSLSLKGNHEEGVLYFSIDFREEASRAITWTREIINSPDYDPQSTAQIWNYLGDLKEQYLLDDFLFVHGSPREPTREYIRPDDILDEKKMQEIFDLIPHVCFCGHTHEPGILVLRPNGKIWFFLPHHLNNSYRLEKDKCIINVGAVGQPRDGDNRACYITLEDGVVNFHRVAYDYQKTMQKIIDTQYLPPLLATRLHLGR